MLITIGFIIGTVQVKAQTGVSAIDSSSLVKGQPVPLLKNKAAKLSPRALKRKLSRLANAEQKKALAGLSDSALNVKFTGLSKAASRQQLTHITETVVPPGIPTGSGQLAANAQRQLSGLSPMNALNSTKQQMLSQSTQLNAQVSKAMGSFKKKLMGFDLALADETRYQPSPLSSPLLISPTYHPKFASIVGLMGSVQAFGVPLNINYSSNQRIATGSPGFDHQLFKFDLDPKMFTNQLKSEFQHYTELKKSAFGGQDLTGYTSKMLTSQLTSPLNTLKGSADLTKYLNDPTNMGQLLELNELQLKSRLLEQLKKEADANQKEVLGMGDLKDPANVTILKTRALAALSAKALAVNQLASNRDLAGFINDPFNKQQFSEMSEKEIFEKLKPVAGKINGQESTSGADSLAQQAAKDEALEGLAHQISLKGGSADFNFNTLVSNQQAALQKHTDAVQTGSITDIMNALVPGGKAGAPADEAELARQAGSAASMLTGLKNELAGKGFDVKRLLQMQQLSGGRAGSSPLSEAQSSLLNKNPANFMQQVFSKFSGLKAGSFGSNLPGSTSQQDMFVSGAQLTFKSNNIPITLGYGGQNDIKSLKDEQFQSTVYNSPKNITFIGAELKRGWGGPLKISVLGSFNKDAVNSQYSLPTISSNNVALTLSKNLRMGKLGEATVDVSKTTTLYANNYVIGSEAILNRKAGLTSSLDQDVFQSLSFGVNHHLDVQSMGMSDDVYFNYAGTGYQNPANNGFGGAEMKFGGKIKKSFDHNKLVVNVRTDFRDQPISYTSNDQWQSLQVQLNTRYTINKQFNVAMQYSNNATSKRVDNLVSSVYGLQKLQFDGNATYKIGKNYSVSHFTLGGQSISNGYLAQPSGRLIMMNYTQSLLINDRSLTMNVFYNKELSDYKLIGDLLNSDLSYQFPVSKKLSLTSGATYLHNTGIAHQVGVKGGVQLAATGHFDIASTIDLRKNLMTPQYADLYAATQAELTIRYHLNY